MPAEAHLRTNFTAGELSPRLDIRIDIDKYNNGVKTLLNCVVNPHGEAASRGGTRFIAEVVDSTKKTRLFPFEFNVTQAYILEFGDQSIRIFKDQGSVLNEDQTITGITQANPGVVTAANHDFNNGDVVLITGVVGMTEVNGKRFTVASRSINAFELSGEDTSGNTAYSSAGTVNRIAQVFVPEAATTISGATAANPVVITTSASHSYSNGDDVFIKEVVGMTEINNRRFKIANASGSTFDLEGEDGSGYTAYSSAGTSQKVSSTAPQYLEAELFQIQTTQSADVLYIVHQNHTPRTLSRFAHDMWLLEDISFTTGPAKSINDGSATNPVVINITNHGYTTGERVIIENSGMTEINDRVFTVTNAGANLFNLDGEDGTGRGGAGGGGTASRYAGFDDWAALDYPSCITFYEQRLVFANSPSHPQRLWFSQSGDFVNLLLGSNDMDAMSYTIASDQVNAIQWLNSGKVLVVGTKASEFVVRASSADQALTPTNVRVTRETNYGSFFTFSKRVANVVLFIQRAQRKIREFIFRFEADTFVAPDLTLLAEHITQSGIVEMTYQQEPDSVIWSPLTNGKLIGMTYQRDQDIVAHHKHEIGGVSDIALTRSLVESAAVIPGTANDGVGIDELWVVVNRLINGSTVRYVELMEPGLEDEEDQEFAFFVDSGLTLNTPLTITGATVANPVVITATAHGFSDGNEVRIRDVVGMTELNHNNYLVIESAANSFEIMNPNNSVPVTAVTEANPGSVTAVEHGFSTGDEVGFLNIGGMTELNGNGYTITVVDDDTFTIGVNTSGFTTFTSGGKAYLNTNGSAFTTYVSGGTAREEVTTITGAGHLEGEVVDVLGNGSVQATQTVSSGSVTISKASIVHIGKNFVADIVTNRPEAGSITGTAQGKIKRFHEIILRVRRTLGLKVGPEGGTLDTIQFRKDTDAMNKAVPLFTGDIKVPYPEGYTTDGFIHIRQDQPLPMRIQGIISRIKTNN